MIQANDAAAFIECFLDVYSDYWLCASPEAEARSPKRGARESAAVVTRLAPVVGKLVHEAGGDPRGLRGLFDPDRRGEVARTCLQARSRYVAHAPRDRG